MNNTAHNKGTAAATASLQFGLEREDQAFNSVSNPALGAFLYRSANGQGTFSSNQMQLQWNYGADGLNDNDVVEVKVFAIEMVWIPTGDFYLGDGGSQPGRYKAGSTLNDPFLVTTDGYTLNTNTSTSAHFEG